MSTELQTRLQEVAADANLSSEVDELIKSLLSVNYLGAKPQLASTLGIVAAPPVLMVTEKAAKLLSAKLQVVIAKRLGLQAAQTFAKRFAFGWVPVLGWATIAYDVISLAFQLHEAFDTPSTKFLMQLCPGTAGHDKRVAILSACLRTSIAGDTPNYTECARAGLSFSDLSNVGSPATMCVAILTAVQYGSDAQLPSYINDEVVLAMLLSFFTNSRWPTVYEQFVKKCMDWYDTHFAQCKADEPACEGVLYATLLAKEIALLATKAAPMLKSMKKWKNVLIALQHTPGAVVVTSNIYRESHDFLADLGRSITIQTAASAADALNTASGPDTKVVVDVDSMTEAFDKALGRGLVDINKFASQKAPTKVFTDDDAIITDALSQGAGLIDKKEFKYEK